MRRFKKALSVSVAAAMAVSMMACGSTPSDTTTAAPQGGDETTEAATTKSGGEAETTKSAASGDKIKMRVSWWGSQTRTDRTMEVLNAYGEKNNIEFDYQFYQWDDYWTTMSGFTTNNALPDIMQQDYAYIGPYVDKGLLVDMNQYKDVMELDKVDESILSSGNIYGKGLYGMSLGTNVLCVIYNKTVYEQAGVDMPTNDWTWDEWVYSVKTIYEKTGVHSDIPFITDPKWLIEYISRSFGETLYNEDGTGFGFTDKTIDAYKKCLADIKEMVDSGALVDPAVQVTWKANEDGDIVKGKSASAWTYSNFYVDYQGILEKNAPDNELDLVLMPKIDGATEKGNYLKPSQFFSITKDSKYPEEAAKVISYFVTDVDANKILLAERGVPVSQSVRDALKSSVDTKQAYTFDFISSVGEYCRAIDNPEPKVAAEVINAFKDGYQSVLYGETTPDEAWETFENDAALIFG